MRALRTAMAVWLAFATVLLWSETSADASGHTLIQGSGSSWAANAVLQWVADVHSSGLQVVFTSNGSAQGRIDFANQTVDFAVSDIGFLGRDPVTQTNDTSNGRAYAYLPIVAGGTALPYHIQVAGHLVRNLRLSGETIAKIFTQKITNWNDPQITKDNNGHALPSLPIIPVQHSEGSGSSYQFTRYLSKEYPNIWKSGATEYFPSAAGSAVAVSGSDGVMNFLTSASGNGAIGYDEYSYALGKNYPVAKVLNSAGYYTLPNQYNVAVALTRAQINTNKSSPDYLLQNLDNVYTYDDVRTYPMSSYSYAIIPIGAGDSKMTTAKRQTLADYLNYSVCQGQAEMGRVGYSPLPINLVQASFDQIAKLHAADSAVDISRVVVTKCNNPTFIAGHPSENYLATVAPKPPACDKVGAGPCTTAGNTGQANPDNGGHVKQTGDSPGSATTGPTSGGSNVGPTANGAGTSPTGTTPTGGNVIRQIDPVTGQVQTGGDPSAAAVAGGAVPAAAATVLPADQSPSSDVVLAGLAGGLLVGILVAPAIATSVMKRKSAP